MPSTSALTMVRPMPVPSMPSFSAPKRLNGSNRLRELYRRQPAAGVAHPQHRLVAGRSGVDHDPAAASVVLDRVRQQVDQHLAQAGGVAACRTVGLGDLDDDAVLRRQRFDQRHRLADQHAEVDRAERQLERARFEAREVEHVVDQRKQVVAGSADVAELGELRRVGRAAGLDLQQLGEAEHRIERRAQLVAHAREELRLGVDLALGEHRLLAHQLGLLGLGHVPVDADPAHRPACSSFNSAEREASQRQPPSGRRTRNS